MALELDLIVNEFSLTQADRQATATTTTTLDVTLVLVRWVAGNFPGFH